MVAAGAAAERIRDLSVANSYSRGDREFAKAVPPRNSIWALITRILCPRVRGGEQIRWQDSGVLR